MAGSTAFNDMLDYTAIELPQCPIAVVGQRLRLATVKFCVESKVWKDYPDAMDIEAAVREVELDTPTGSRIASLISIQLGGTDLEPTDIQSLANAYPNWHAITGTPRAYWLDDTNVVRLFPLPSATIAAKLVCVTSLAPTLAAESIPAWLWEKHHEAIIAKTKVLAFLMPRKPWTDPNSASVAESVYQEALANARFQSARGGGRSRLRTTSTYM